MMARIFAAIFFLLVFCEISECLMSPQQIKVEAFDVFANNLRSYDTKVEPKVVNLGNYVENLSKRKDFPSKVRTIMKNIKDKTFTISRQALFIYRAYRTLWGNVKSSDNSVDVSNLSVLEKNLKTKIDKINDLFGEFVHVTFTNDKELKLFFPGMNEFKQLLRYLYEIIADTELVTLVMILHIEHNQNRNINQDSIGQRTVNRIHPIFTCAEEGTAQVCLKRRRTR